MGTRFTFGPAPGAFPIWSPDGKALAYGDAQGTVWMRSSDGAEEAKTIYSEGGQPALPTSWSPDGKSIALMWQHGKAGFDVAEVDASPDAKLRPLVSTQYNEQVGRYSPDGRWFSWISDESGRPELFVAPYPSFAAKWQVSSSEAGLSFWSADGRSIYYTTPENKLMVVDVDPSGDTLRIGSTKTLFGGNSLPSSAFAMSPDRKRILAPVPTGAGMAPELTLVTNWGAALKRR